MTCPALDPERSEGESGGVSEIATAEPRPALRVQHVCGLPRPRESGRRGGTSEVATPGPRPAPVA
jgi:hypothetical protein